MNRILCWFLVVTVCVGEGYSTHLRNKRQTDTNTVPREFQNINIDNYFKNKNAVKFQLKCVIDDGPCDKIGKYLKETIPAILTNQCADCDTAQKERAGTIFSHIQQNYPEDWGRSIKKFVGGPIKPEDAARLQTNIGIKIDPKFVGESTTSEHQSTTRITTAVPISRHSSTVPTPSKYPSEDYPSHTTTVAPTSTPAVDASSSGTLATSTSALIFLCSFMCLKHIITNN